METEQKNLFERIVGKDDAAGGRPGQAFWNDWRWQVRASATGGDAAVRLSGARDPAAARIRAVTARYPFRVTPYYLSLIDRRSAHDPIRRQCIPDVRELDDREGVREGAATRGVRDVSPDPFDEERYSPVAGLVRRFRDRVVVVATTFCGVYCRHCTRKNTLPRQGVPATREGFGPILRYLGEHPEIREVILSGGDPLLLDDELLDWLLARLNALPGVDVVRIGTRVPVVLPMRIDGALASRLARHRPLWVNTHFNHPAELTAEALAACEHLLRVGIPVSNQTVLLRGVNDDADTLAVLFNSLQKHMIRPYYAFLCDPVSGTAHFQTRVAEARALEDALRGRLGGLALPRFVADVPGACGKVPIDRLPPDGYRDAESTG